VFVLCYIQKSHAYRFKTFLYSLVYIPLPGPPALKDPPPPIIRFNTHDGTKSFEPTRGIDSRPIITCDKTAKPDGPGNAGISQSSYNV